MESKAKKYVGNRLSIPFLMAIVMRCPITKCFTPRNKIIRYLSGNHSTLTTKQVSRLMYELS